MVTQPTVLGVCTPRLSRSETRQALADQGIGSAHDAVAQLLDGRDIVDQARNHTSRPCAGIHGTLGHDLRINPGYFTSYVFKLDVCAQLLFFFEQPFHSIIGKHSLGIT